MRQIIVFLSSVWFITVTAQLTRTTTNPFAIFTTVPPKEFQTPAPGTATPVSCITDDSRDGFCVSPSLCSGGVLSTTGVTSAISSMKRLGDLCNPGEVCCASSAVTTLTPRATTPRATTPRATTPRATTPRATTPRATTPRATTPRATTPIMVFPSEGCGKSDSSTMVRAVADSPIFMEFPWVVPIFEVRRGIDVFMAGGSLIHPRLVLSYAVRFRRGTYVVRAGDYDISNTDELFDYQRIEVEKVIKHKKFSSGNFRNNIALLLLRTPVQPADNIGYMCLASASTPVTTGQICTVVGWGQETMDNGTLRDEPKLMKVPVVDRQKCQADMRPHTKPTFNLHTSEFCAGGVDYIDVCKGDGGSPLFCEYAHEPSRYYQAGIVSWGKNCEGELPTMYADVAVLRPWIDETVTAEGLDASFYTP